jgi:predicted amidohydrolase
MLIGSLFHVWFDNRLEICYDIRLELPPSFKFSRTQSEYPRILFLLLLYRYRFPEHHTILRRKGAEILSIPSAFTLKTGKDHWRLLLQGNSPSYKRSSTLPLSFPWLIPS